MEQREKKEFRSFPSSQSVNVLITSTDQSFIQLHFLTDFCIFVFRGVELEQQKMLSPMMPMAWKFGQSSGDRMPVPFMQDTGEKEVLPSPSVSLDREQMMGFLSGSL